jgi:sulfite exporter TauE/SafE
MWILIAAVASASLLGSTHCVGMCGPLAMWASGVGDSASSRGQVVRSTALYHLGRLLTYSLAGAIAGGLGSLVDVGGGALGIQLAAARIVGAMMIVIGLVRLMPLLGFRKSQATGPKPSRIAAIVAKARPFVYQLSPSARALTVGLLTTLLPCGWLYLFALVAAGTGDIISGAIVMAAFWLGTVPALTAMIAGTMVLSNRLIKTVPIAAALLLIVAGGYTAMGRGFADLHSLADIRSSADISAVQPAGQSSQPKCCCQGESTCGAPDELALHELALENSVNESTSDIAAQIKVLTETPLPCCAESAASPE